MSKHPATHDRESMLDAWERFTDDEIDLHEMALIFLSMVDEIEQRRDNWGDLRVRLLQARHNVMAMHARTSPPDPRLNGKREGFDIALDYMRAYAVPVPLQVGATGSRSVQPWTEAEHDAECGNGGCPGYEFHRVRVKNPAKEDV